MKRCLAAYTPPSGSYPPYINASLIDGAVVEVLIRDPTGVHAMIELTPEAWASFLAEANNSNR